MRDGIRNPVARSGSLGNETMDLFALKEYPLECEARYAEI